MAPNPSSLHLPAAMSNEQLSHSGSQLPAYSPLKDDVESGGTQDADSKTCRKSLKTTNGVGGRPAAPKCRSSHNKYKSMAQLAVFAIAELIGGFTFSLLSPFYTKEATSKGLSVAQTGLVYGSVFVTTILFSPIFGKYINVIGSRNLFLYGTFLAGSTNVLFGFLEYVSETQVFFILSLAVRIVSAIGEAAFFCAIYPLAAQAAPSRYRSTVLSVMETMFGLGLMVGPFFGGVLYELDGFYLPFVVCGGTLTLCPLFAVFFIGGTTGTEPVVDEERTPFMKLLKMPCIFFSCFILCIAQSSVAWYLPTLQPFLEDNYQLTTVATGAMFTVEGATYAAFSPLWGWLLDKWISPWTAFVTGTICVIIGYCLLGPNPYLPFIPANIYLVGFALSIMGFGVAATFITTLTFMLSESVVNGAADNEQTRGMITSLWFISENLGGYIGASLGGLTFDTIGFENGTIVVIGMQLLALVAIPLMWKLNQRSKKPNADKPNDERTKLIDKRTSYLSIAA